MANEAIKSLRISQVGLRGVVGPGMTAAHVLDFASAFGTFLEPGRSVIVGRDPRASGVMIREGVVAALLACGHDVVDLGIAPTPVIQHTIRRLDAAGGISIGASHNAAEWNALKFFGRNAIYLSTAEANELLDIYHLRKFSFVEWNQLGNVADRTECARSVSRRAGGGIRFRCAAPVSRGGGLLQRNVLADPAAHERALRTRVHSDQRKNARRGVRARARHQPRHGGARSSPR